MTCPDPSRLSAAASGEDLAAEAHASACASCHHTLSAERSLRALASHLPPLTLSTSRRRALEATLLALAERAPPASRPSRRPGRATLAAALLAAAIALLAWRVLSPSSAPHASSPPSPASAPHASSPPAPTTVVPLAAPKLVATPGARFEHRSDLIVVTEGTLSLDATTTPSISLADTSPTPTRVRADGAHLEVRATRGAIHAVQVFAGSVEVVHGDRTIIITAGATWTPPTVRTPDAATLSAARTPDLSNARPPAARPATRDGRASAFDHGRAPSPTADTPTEPSAFAAAWQAWHAGDLTAAAAGFERAARDPALAEDARFWLAATHARAGNAPLATTTYASFLTAHPSSPHAGAAHLALARLLSTTDPTRAAHHRARAAADVDPRIRASALSLTP